mmetsp:Transcript_115323/g.372670  ORF Transcript_115323/g.372670 Transcript_115323/m.372670 type:complete len:85 (-) Transcript_115323:16-270(-)
METVAACLNLQGVLQFRSQPCPSTCGQSTCTIGHRVNGSGTHPDPLSFNSGAGAITQAMETDCSPDGLLQKHCKSDPLLADQVG